METFAIPIVKTVGAWLAVAAFGLGPSIFPLPAAHADTLESFRWKNRMLLLFAPSESDPDYGKVNTDVEMESAAVEDRDLVIGRVLENGPSTFGAATLTDREAELLRKRFSVNKGQTVILLIGKDGGLKLRRNGSVDIREIFVLIDGMPMRQQELRGR